MVTHIDTVAFLGLMDYGIRNLSLYKEKVNALNVFPVPDGDTGTNMLITLKSGLDAVSDGETELNSAAKSFAKGVTFGARGNSGVIASQFFKGVAEAFFENDQTADRCQLLKGLENGVQSAYKAVAEPVEGTMLTVLREATAAVKDRFDKLANVSDMIGLFLDEARASLERTPQLLEVLRASDVVDSGGAGIVYLFEGMNKYLKNEPLPVAAESNEAGAMNIDYSLFNEDSTFEYGYCTELLIQLTRGGKAFIGEEFRKQLCELGGSIVVTVQDDKVKLHIHTFTPEKILAFCHDYGEFLAIKIENMAVQHRETVRYENQISVSGQGENFSVIAVAHDSSMKARFREMGADIIISGIYAQPPAAADFVKAFSSTKAENILVFPNNKNTELAVHQAGTLIKDKNIFVISTRSDADCYAVLPMIDFGCTDMQKLVEDINQSINNVETVSVTRAGKDTVYQQADIRKGQFVALKGTQLISAGSDIVAVTKEAIQAMFGKKDCQVLTVFANNTVSDVQKEEITSFVQDISMYVEVDVIDTDDDFYSVILSFE